MCFPVSLFFDVLIPFVVSSLVFSKHVAKGLAGKNIAMTHFVGRYAVNLVN